MKEMKFFLIDDRRCPDCGAQIEKLVDFWGCPAMHGKLINPDPKDIVPAYERVTKEHLLERAHAIAPPAKKVKRGKYDVAGNACIAKLGSRKGFTLFGKMGGKLRRFVVVQ